MSCDEYGTLLWECFRFLDRVEVEFFLLLLRSDPDFTLMGLASETLDFTSPLTSPFDFIPPFDLMRSVSLRAITRRVGKSPCLTARVLNSESLKITEAST
eukprot:1389976-Amorphochlora_amoeboformis.AAC.1